MKRPFGITLIALAFCGGGAYLWVLGAVVLISPGAISLMAGKSLMYGQQLAGPYMILLFGTGYAAVGLGLVRLQNWARWVAMGLMVISVAALVPAISMADLGAPVLLYGLQIALRVAVGWYLAQAPAVIGAFAAKP